MQASALLAYNRGVHYQKYAILGFSWQTIQKILLTGLSLLKIFILARLLNPEQFGIFSLVMITLGVTESLTQTGINTTILQAKQSVAYFLDTAFVIAIIRGFAIASLMILGGYIMSNYYQQSELLPMIAVASLVPIIKGFINPAIVSWQKNLVFAKDSLYTLLRSSIEIFAQIILAYLLHSSWALVLGAIVGAVFEVTLSFIMLKERPIFRLVKSRAQIILQNGKWLSLSSLLNYLNDNVDDFLLGKILGIHQLGIYHNAYAMSHKANYELSKSAYHGILPIFSKIIQNQEIQRLKRAFYKSFFSTLLIVSLLSIPLIFFPKVLVELFLGAQWLEVTQILAALTLAGLVQTMANLCYALIIARKKYLYLNTHMFVSLFLTVSGMLIFAPSHGLVGAVNALFLARFLALPIVFFGAKKSLS
mgnify:FL=1